MMAVSMEEVGRFERERRRRLLWYLPGVVAMSVNGVAVYSLPDMSGPMRTGLAALVFVVFGGSIIKLCVWMFRLYQRSPAERKELESALQDERVCQNRLLAARDAFWVILIVNVLLSIPGTEYPHWIHPTALTSILLGVGCLSFAGSFLWRDRE